LPRDTAGNENAKNKRAEARSKSESAKQELEGKIPPFSAHF
jgi:hypothetical protein